MPRTILCKTSYFSHGKFDFIVSCERERVLFQYERKLNSPHVLSRKLITEFDVLNVQSLTQPPNHALGYAIYANNAQ
jgi:hypothetical protein